MKVVRLALSAGLVVVATLMYLREPSWLSRVESGIRGWETGTDGVRARWTSGHASFFVSSRASTVNIPVRTTFDRGANSAVRVRVTIDDQPAVEIVLTDAGWRSPTVELPPPGPRGLRRVDVRVDRVRPGNRGVLLGEIRIE